MAVTQVYVDPAIAGDSGTGTIGDPYGDLQYALNTAVRNTTDGTQLNIKVGTAEVLGAALDLTTFGLPGDSAPLILRGYTSAANDGGMAEVDCGGYTMFANTSLVGVHLIDLDLHNFGNNAGINWNGGGRNWLLWRCRIHKGASSPSGKALIFGTSNTSSISDCYVYDPGTSGICIYMVNSVFSCYIKSDAAGSCVRLTEQQSCVGNIVHLSNAGGIGINSSDGTSVLIANNIVYNSSAGTLGGIYGNSGASRNMLTVLNNIVVGFSGAGGAGIKADGNVNIALLGYNAFYNNTTNVVIADTNWENATANDVALAANPFTDAANGDFSLTAAAKTALAAKGFPAAYLGAHANTVPNLNIGPIQMAGGGGRPAFGDRTGGKF